ncbi:hypothetical protein DACRYDRAFT_114096 [Dacryopinax primogenitus]|uniref:Uncharacterized protein n=1 Tax=Dacryopinax primogenitus (strain DJM 731) TaxID=1858805 RepID=M5GDS0_DACPD|nr:uncharacterized protein DACRYDRAFT_114096 [Dacryopinax primogenitus]EJU04767.1 hypothetical protein DACRYDRAFT_114096 [Dacryopinax primogenitus]
MSTSRSSSRSSSATVASEPLRTLRNLYPQAARAFLNRSPSVPMYLEKAFVLLSPVDEHDSAREGAALVQQRIKWDVLRLTWEANVYPLTGASNGITVGKGKGKEKENGHAMSNGNGMPQPNGEMDLLALPPAVLLPAIHARSLVLFTPPAHKASSLHLPSEVILALTLFAVKLGMYSVARDWVELWWLVRGSADVDDDDEIKGRRKIRESMVLRVFPGMKDWESAHTWATGELEGVVQEELLTSLDTLKVQAAQEELTQSRLAASAYGTSRISLPPSPAPTSSRGTPARSPSRTPPPRPSSPASSSSSTATHSTHTATPATPRPARAGLTLTPTGTVRGSLQPSDTNTVVPLPLSAPPIPQATPRPPNLYQVLLKQMKQSFSSVGWLFVVLIPLLALVLRLRATRTRARRSVATGGPNVARGAMQWLWKAVVDAVDMAGRGLV